jgi:hypothetical protein
MLKNVASNRDDGCVWRGDEVYLFLQQFVPPVIPVGPRYSCTIDEHRSLGPIRDVVPLRGLAQIAASTIVNDEVLNRGEEVPEPGFHLRPCLICRASPAAEGRLHTYEYVPDYPFWLRIGQKDVAIGFRERLHPFFKLSIPGIETWVDSHG